MDVRKALQATQNTGDFVRLVMTDGNHDGFVLAVSPELVLLQVIHDWHDGGALVVPVGLVESVEVSEDQENMLKILEFNSIKRTKRYSGVRISDWPSLFKSLKPKGRFCVISFGEEAEVGLVDTVEPELVVLKAIDSTGNWLPDELECDYGDITMVQFDDNYSRVLQRYVEHKAKATQA